MSVPSSNRRLYANQIVVTAGVASTQLLPPNDRRNAIVIGAHNANRVTLDFKGPAVLDQGITLQAGGSPLVLLYDHIGQAIRESIQCIASAGSTPIGVLDIIEVDCPCDDKYAAPISSPTPNYGRK